MIRRRLLTAGAIALVIAVVLAGALFGPYLVTIDGYPQWVGHGTTVAELVAQHRVRAFPGDLYDIRGGLLEPRRGDPVVVEVNGSIASSETVVGFGATVTSQRGRNAVEPTVVTTVETTPTVVYRGHGPVESVESSGTPGTAREVRGAISGIVIESARLTAPQPTVVRLEPVWPGRKWVALTFDDGPWPGSTDAVLAQLVAAKVKATFFMVGQTLKSRPEIGRRVLAAGMEVGDHSYSHKYLVNDPPDVVTREIAWGASTIEDILGVRPVWYRPAGGFVTPFVFSEARRLHLRVVLWTIDPHDYRRPGVKVIARRVLDNVRPGSVVLMHDGGGDRSQTVAALQVILKGLAARGYSMVTLSELYSKPKP